MTSKHMSRARLSTIVLMDDEYGSDIHEELDELPDEYMMERYGLTKYDLTMLHWIKRSKRFTDQDTYSLNTKQHGQGFLEIIQEVIHQGYEFWSMEDQVVIRAFLSDVTYALTLCSDNGLEPAEVVGDPNV